MFSCDRMLTNECRAKIKYVGEFCRLKIHSLALQREKKEHVLNWRSKTDHGSK